MHHANFIIFKHPIKISNTKLSKFDVFRIRLNASRAEKGTRSTYQY